MRPEVPPKPDRMRDRHNQPEPEEECNYLEPIQRHPYEEPIYIDMTTNQQEEEEGAYAPV